MSLQDDVAEKGSSASASGREPQTTDDAVLVDWIGPNDPENPFNWSKGRKWLVTFAALFATFTSMINGTIITVAHEAINDEFGISDTDFPHSYWPVTSWALGGALCSFLVLPVMEDFGIRKVFLGTYFTFLCFLIPQALAQNFATLVVTRFFAGGCVSILANTVAGVIGNVWEGDEARTIPNSLFITTYLTGSSMGPVLGAAIFQAKSWRWISWVQLICFSAFFPLYFAAFRESRGTAILAARARKLRADGVAGAYTAEERDQPPLSQLLLESVRRPLYMLFTEPVVFVGTLMSASIVGTTYLFTQSVEQVFAGLYGWDAVQCGYVQAAIVVGECIGWTGTLVSARLYFASAARNVEVPGTPIPEARLYVSVFGILVGMSGGMFVYAWTAYSNLHWIAPAIGLAMVGAGNEIVIIAVVDYLTDAYSKYAASAMASLALGENVFAAFLPLAAQSMYQTLGFHWASSLLAFVALALACAPVITVIWGREIRASSPFMREAVFEKRVIVEPEIEAGV